MQPAHTFYTLPDEAHVRLRHVLAPLGPVPVTKSTWYQWIAAGEAPRPVRLGPGVAAWRVGTIREWLRARAA